MAESGPFKECRGRLGWIQLRLQGTPCGADLGSWGEWVSLQYLLREGWDVIARNWRTRAGELDLIAFDLEYLVFLEVKTRKLPSFLPAEFNLDEDKKDQLERLAYRFLFQNDLCGSPIRFDLIAVETPDWQSYRLRHYKGFM